MKKNKDYDQKNILIAAGGTGGHIYPALALADKLTLLGANVFWVATKSKVDQKILANKYPMLSLSVQGVRGHGLKRKLLMPVKVLSSLFFSIRFLFSNKIDVVIAFGGYASFAPSIAGKLLFKPVMLHEQNAKIGLTNYYLSFIAKKIMTAFPIVGNLSKSKAVTVGMPVRKEIEDLVAHKKKFNSTKLAVLILGGSQGAQYLNDIMPSVFSTLLGKINLEVVHQCGDQNVAETASKYGDLDISLDMKGFIDDMASAYRWADIVICRSGASTVFEVAATGTPAIFIPYPYATDNHQYYNAQYIVSNGGGECIQEKDLTVDVLAKAITDIYLNTCELERRSKLIKGSYSKNALKDMISVIDEAI
jgi:UDP-N-acetylglucosamine--N-acetylmuramyl-(pentapeptide) pyrophosphoryl-undecaprenol N-acetylglucosamine transferase